MTESPEMYLRDFKIGDIPVTDCQFMDISNSIRLYFAHNLIDAIIDGGGFDFLAFEHTGVECRPETNDGEITWHPEFTTVEVLFSGIAYWDGLRHLYMCDKKTDNYGYHYYPKTVDYVTLFAVLGELQRLYCSCYDPD